MTGDHRRDRVRDMSRTGAITPSQAMDLLDLIDRLDYYRLPWYRRAMVRTWRFIKAMLSC